MLEGDADKTDPLKVADEPDAANGAAGPNDNAHETRVDEVTVHESQLSTMSPVTVDPPIA